MDDDISVIVVDDHEMFAESVARLLDREEHIEVRGQAATVAEGVELARRTRPTVAVVDWRLPDGDGSDAARRINELGLDTKILILTGAADDHALVAAVEAGCAGFVTKDRALAELVDAIKTAALGDAYIDPTMLASLLPRFNQQRRGVGSDLTKREREILNLLAQGMSNQAISTALFVSVHTVRNHVQNVLTKLNAHSKLEAVAIATREGLISR